MTESTSRTHPESWILPFRFALPKTRQVLFEQKLQTTNAPTLATLRRISQEREELRGLLDQESSQSQTAIEKYLPDFNGLVEAFKSLPPETSRSVRWPWTTAVGKKCAAGPMETPSPYWELISLYMGLGISMRNRAIEHVRGIAFSSDQEEMGEKLKFVNGLFTKSAGIFEHAGSLLSPWSDRPAQDIPEMNFNCFSALSELCLAEAQEATIVKGLLGGIGFRALAKLCMGASSKFQRVVELLKGGKMWEETIPEFCNYLLVKTVLWKGISHKLLAEQETEEGNHGKAVSQIREAFYILSSESKALQLGGLSTLWTQQFNEIQSLKNSYESNNENIYYETIPDFTAVRGLIEPAFIAKTVPFVPSSNNHVNIIIEGSSACSIQ